MLTDKRARAVRRDIAARITVLCRIEDGGELVCPRTTVQTVEGEDAMFQTWGETVETLFRAAPALADGRAAAGRWVSLNFVLKPGG
jgi:hypothetical protein